MKFIHVASYKDEFFNGIKSVLQELVPEQRKIGHEVYVFNQEYNENEVISGEQYISSLKEFKDGIKSICPDFVIFHEKDCLETYLPVEGSYTLVEPDVLSI